MVVTQIHWSFQQYVGQEKFADTEGRGAGRSVLCKTSHIILPDSPMHPIEGGLITGHLLLNESWEKARTPGRCGSLGGIESPLWWHTSSVQTAGRHAHLHRV